MFFAIIEEKSVELMLSDLVKESLKKEGYEILNPLEYNSMRTVVVRQCDIIIDYYTEEQIKEDLMRANEWMRVEEVIKLPVLSKMIKIRMKSTEMTQKALRDGLYVLNQSIPPKNVERELFIKLKPCTNCFSYEHITKNCNENKMNLCSNCSTEGHRSYQCKAKTQKCVNCGGNHNTMAARCPKRKEIIKERSKQIRERSRSRANTQSQSYAAAASNMRSGNSGATRSTPNAGYATGEIVATLLAAITFSHYTENMRPGTFQKTMDKMLELNGLPKIKFPTEDLITETEETMRNLVENIRKKQTEEQNVTTEREQNMEYQRQEYTKRHRESLDGDRQKQKRAYEEPVTDDESIPAAPPSSPEDVRGGERVGSLRTKYEQNQQQQQHWSQPTSHQKQQEQQQQQRDQQKSQGAITKEPKEPKEQRKRVSSLSKLPNLTTKDIGVKCLIKPTHGISAETLNNPKEYKARNWVRDLVLRGDAKCIWDHPLVSPESIKKLFERGDPKPLSEVTYIITDDFDKFTEEIDKKRGRKSQVLHSKWV